MCVYMHSRFIENHPIRILEDGPLISEVVLSQFPKKRSKIWMIGPVSCSDDGYGSLASRSDLRKANDCPIGQAEAVSYGQTARERANWVSDWPGWSLEDPVIHVAQRRHATHMLLVPRDRKRHRRRRHKGGFAEVDDGPKRSSRRAAAVASFCRGAVARTVAERQGGGTAAATAAPPYTADTCALGSLRLSCSSLPDAPLPRPSLHTCPSHCRGR
jgi:hypothetical protein